jgi:hypothetical protein
LFWKDGSSWSNPKKNKKASDAFYFSNAFQIVLFQGAGGYFDTFDGPVGGPDPDGLKVCFPHVARRVERVAAPVAGERFFACDVAFCHRSHSSLQIPIYHRRGQKSTMKPHWGRRNDIVDYKLLKM